MGQKTAGVVGILFFRNVYKSFTYGDHNMHFPNSLG
jgi:hypothetical protein